MSPDELAKMHSQIIDNKLNDLRELFKSVNVDADSKLKALFNGLEFSNEGMVLKNAKNRRLINKAVGLVRKKTRELRPIVFDQYKQAAEQINGLANNYIEWLKK